MPLSKYQLHKERKRLLNSRKTKFYMPNNLQLKSFEKVVEMQMGCNKFFTLYEYASDRFIKWHLVDELLGYSNNKFTNDALNNLNQIVFNDDLAHKQRYDSIIYTILESEKKIGVRMDSFCLSLRLFHGKDKSIVPVRRRSYIFEVSKDNRLLTQLDEWEITNRYKSNHVFPELIIKEAKLREKITEDFYRKNLAALPLKIKDQELRVLHYKVKGDSNTDISNKIFLSEQAVANTHSKNVEILRMRFQSENNLFKKTKLGKGIKENINVFREICKLYGLYPVPETILRINPHKKRS